MLSTLEPYVPERIRNVGRFVVRPEAIEDTTMQRDLRRWYLIDIWLLM
jgi:hypothetical protein